MFRRWLSSFKSRNRNKFELIFKVFLVSSIILFSLYFMFFKMENKKDNVDKSQTVYKPQETIISGKDVSEEKFEADSNIITDFVDYCNNGEVKQAYELLTDECKENLYPSLKSFKQKYCDRYFSEEKDYNLQSWVNEGKLMTYKMRITEDMLSTGKYETGSAYQDYITIVDSENGKKININGYITRTHINKTTETEGIKIKVDKVDVYMDYEEYTLEVTNNTENVIILDNMQHSTRNLVLELKNDNKNSVITNSISYIKLIVNPEETKKIKIQFNKGYINDSKADYIIFSKIVKNYNEFIKNQKEYDDFISIKVEL